jgi:hypothetical protein
MATPEIPLRFPLWRTEAAVRVEAVVGAPISLVETPTPVIGSFCGGVRYLQRLELEMSRGSVTVLLCGVL